MKQLEEPGIFSRAANISIQPNPGQVKCNISLLLSSDHTFLIFVCLSLLLHSLQLIQLPECGEQSPVKGEGSAAGKGAVRGELWGAPHIPLPGHREGAGHRVKTAREDGTLEEEANAATKLKISMVDFQFSQVVEPQGSLLPTAQPQSRLQPKAEHGGGLHL